MTHATKHERTKRPTPRPRGMAMLLVLIAIAVAMILSMSFLNSQSTSVGVTKNLGAQARARGIAQSAMQMAILHVQATPTWRSDHSHGVWASNQALAGGTFTLRGEDGVYNPATGTLTGGDGSLTDDPTDPATLTVTATYDGVTDTVRAVVRTTTGNTKSILLVVPNAGSLGTHDQARKSQFESLGWLVTPWSENANQNDTDDACDDATVVYVSGTVGNNSAIANKIKDQGLGILCEQGTLQDLLGLASADATTLSASQLNLTNNSHYITNTLATGTRTFSTTSQTIYVMGTTLGAGVEILAQRLSATNGVLAVIDAGGILQSGGTAEARRVFLPWGTSTFDPTKLTADAQTILSRSLDWAANFDGTGTAQSNSIAVSDYVFLEDEGRIDSFDASLGAYGGANIGSAAIVSTNSTKASKIIVKNSADLKGNALCGAGGTPSSVIVTQNSGVITGTKTAQSPNAFIPTVTVPTNLGTSVGDRTYSSGTTTLATSFRCRDFTVTNSAVVQISGHVTILVDRNFQMDDSAQFKVLANSSVVIYCKRIVTFDDEAQFNVNSATPSVALLYCTSNKAMNIIGEARVYATIIAPNRRLVINEEGHLYGTFIGKRILVEDEGALSMDATNTAIIAGDGSATYTCTATWSH